MTEIVHTIFKSPSIQFVEVDGYRSVRSSRDIEAGDLLLVEHSLACVESSRMVDAVRGNQLLFDNLYPRGQVWTQELFYSDESIKLAKEKVQKNMFKNADTFHLGLNASRFNHTKRPNAVIQQMYVERSDLPMHPSFLYIVATEAIPQDREILIWYGNNFFGEHSDEDKYERKKLQDYKTMAEMFVRQYMKKKTFAQVMSLQIVADQGLYKIDKLHAVTERFHQFFRQLTGHSPSMDEVVKWIEFYEDSCITKK